jgi:hypothetical protein
MNFGSGCRRSSAPSPASTRSSMGFIANITAVRHVDEAVDHSPGTRQSRRPALPAMSTICFVTAVRSSDAPLGSRTTPTR